MGKLRDIFQDYFLKLVFLLCCLANRKKLARGRQEKKKGKGSDVHYVVTIKVVEHISTKGRACYQKFVQFRCQYQKNDI